MGVRMVCDYHLSRINLRVRCSCVKTVCDLGVMCVRRSSRLRVAILSFLSSVRFCVVFWLVSLRCSGRWFRRVFANRVSISCVDSFWCV